MDACRFGMVAASRCTRHRRAPVATGILPGGRTVRRCRCNRGFERHAGRQDAALYGRHGCLPLRDGGSVQMHPPPEVARGGRQRAQERFHPDVIARRHVKIYREVLGRVS